MDFTPKTPFEAVVIEKFEVIEKRLEHFHTDLYETEGLEFRLRRVEGDSKVLVSDVKNLQKDRPRLFWLVGIASLIGGFLGRLVPWRG